MDVRLVLGNASPKRLSSFRLAITRAPKGMPTLLLFVIWFGKIERDY
jgi:hypothetical protein